MSSWPETRACANDCDVFIPRIPKDPYLPYNHLKNYVTVILFYLFFFVNVIK